MKGFRRRYATPRSGFALAVLTIGEDDDLGGDDEGDEDEDFD